MSRPLIPPLPPHSRVWRGTVFFGGWVPDHQARRNMANRLVHLINADRRAINCTKSL